jgi:sugar transferase EpsL
MRQAGARWLVKVAFDRVVALLGLVLLAPLLASLVLLVRLRIGSPVFFRQKRPGLGGRIIEIVKFRSMTDERGPGGELLPDERRLTGLGRALRATSLDELPQLWNVLKGDLSLVGPRPLLVQYLERYTPEQARRHEVLPGITGWAQINGRNAVSWEERFRLDVWYVDNWSLALDLRILAGTFLRVLTRDGISARDSATMPEFMGRAPE